MANNDQTSKMDRMQSLAQRLNVRTSAKTPAGLLKALKKVNFGAKPLVGYQHRRATQITLSKLIELCAKWQKGARVRTIDDNAPLTRAVRAAMRKPYIDNASAVANCYQGVAYESLCSAERFGSIVALNFDRFRMTHRSHGRGSWDVSALDGCRFVKVSDLAELVKSHKQGQVK